MKIWLYLAAMHRVALRMVDLLCLIVSIFLVSFDVRACPKTGYPKIIQVIRP